MFRTFALTLAISSAILFTSCTKCSKEDAKPATEAAGQVAGSKANDVTELKIETLKPSTSAVVATSGKRLNIHYTGTLADGKVFDSSETRKAPLSFVLGTGQVIPGWEKGVEGMKVGERRRLTIPANLAYGEKGIGNIIPPNATLIFEIELLSVE
jgi:FKBP-type peptidyl-prolyl cis-trans isomerase